MPPNLYLAVENAARRAMLEEGFRALYKPSVVSVLVLENLSLSYGGRSIIKELSLRIGEDDRIGLVGRNGSGKSSLMKIIAGLQEPDEGQVRRARTVSIGYLPQDIEASGGLTLLDSVLSSVPGRAQLEESLQAVEGELSRAQEEAEQMALSQKLVNLHEDIAHFDQHYSTHEAHAILAGLGFSTADAGRDLGEFSGGWKMRAMLASLLFQKPDLLMLDEPTNHLDVGTVTWLEEFLKSYPNAMLLVCHDRRFLNAQVNRIVSYEAEGIRQYPGDYDRYLRLRAEQREVLERRAANIAREREAAERFIRRFRAQATKARAVQSRVKSLERLDEVITFDSQAGLSFKFPPCQRAGQDVMELDGLGHSYGELRVFSSANLIARRGDRVAIIGPNGAGKTTLLRIISGELKATEGSVKLGHNVCAGYYAQHVAETLDRASSVFDEVWRNSVLDDLSQVRSVLGTFLFSGEDVDKRIAVLSGGEKARVALARLMVNPGNLLLMDEPTNHLDLESSEALAVALDSYDGTLVFVSHNRSFIERLATRIWHVHDGCVEEFPGNFEQFLYHVSSGADSGVLPSGGGDALVRGIAGTGPGGAANRVVGRVGGSAKLGLQDDAKAGKGGAASLRKGEVAAGSGSARAGKAMGASAPTDVSPAVVESKAQIKERRLRERQASKARDRQVRSLERSITDLERRIAEMEEAQEQRGKELSKPEIFEDRRIYGELLSTYTEAAKKLEELMARWEHAHASLAELRE